jgi:hypothetical protein
VSYFQAVRRYSQFELVLFSGLVVCVIMGWDSAELVLGWAHGFGWIFLCGLVGWGWRRGDFNGPVLAATVSPLGPLGSTIGIEWLAHSRRRHAAAAAG